MQNQTVAFSKDSRNLFFHILTKCNLSCSHCYINPSQHGTRTLEIDTIKQWLNIFKERAGQTNLVFLGGEPTLHPDLSIMVKSARKMGFKSITIDTNGYLFHDILDKITPTDVDFISFSLDGATRKTNDAIRGDGCYEAVFKGIEKAVLKGFHCSMIYTVSDRNIHELEKMPQMLENSGIELLFIQVLGMRGVSLNQTVSKEKMLQVDKKTWTRIVPEVARQIAQKGIDVTYPKVFLDLNEPFECAGIVADNYFIFPNGRVYQCPICEDFPFHSYEIKNHELIPTPKINEQNLFSLDIPEGCVMNKMIQPQNLSYDQQGSPLYKVACCMLKQEIKR